MAFSLLFLGPAPFIGLEPSVSLIQGVAGLIGFGSANVMVSSFLRAQRAAINQGFCDDITTYIFIAGELKICLRLGLGTRITS